MTGKGTMTIFSYSTTTTGMYTTNTTEHARGFYLEQIEHVYPKEGD
jgi:hypothetical protein